MVRGHTYVWISVVVSMDKASSGSLGYAADLHILGRDQSVEILDICKILN